MICRYCLYPEGIPEFKKTLLLYDCSSDLRCHNEEEPITRGYVNNKLAKLRDECDML